MLHLLAASIIIYNVTRCFAELLIFLQHVRILTVKRLRGAAVIKRKILCPLFFYW